MDPLSVYCRPYVPALNGYASKLNASTNLAKPLLDELGDVPNVNQVTSSFSALNMSPLQKTDVPTTSYYFQPNSTVPPFTQNNKHIVNMFNGLTHERASKSPFPGNLCAAADDGSDNSGSSPTKSGPFMSSPVEEFISCGTGARNNGSSCANSHFNGGLYIGHSENIILPTPQKIPTPQKTPQKFQDLSAGVPEFIPRSKKKKSPLPENSCIEINNTHTAENVNGTTYFYPSSMSVTPPTSTDSISAASPFSSPVSFDSPLDMQYKQMPDTSISYYIPSEFKSDMVLIDPATDVFHLPEKVENYCNLEPLEPLLNLPSNSLPGYVTTMYKATHIKSGVTYCLRRVHDTSLPSAKCNTVANTWKKLSHTNLVHLNDMFTTTDFGDNSIVFAYDYFSDCETLLTKHFYSQTEGLNGYMDTFSSDPNAPKPYSHTKNALLRQQHSAMMPESALWSYAIQLTGALRVMHAAGLSCRCIDPTKIIICGKNRVRIGGIAISDIVLYDPSLTNRLSMTSHFQQEDLSALGKLLLALACGSLIAIHRDNMQTSLEIMSRTYSKDIKNLIGYLLSTTNQKRSVLELMPMIGARFYSQIDAMQLQCDVLQNDMRKETDHKRLLRLIIKLAIINERLDLSSDPESMESGDRYMLMLFRDYLYNQMTDDQRPWFNMTHIISCLNKLEAGSQEKICLMPKNEESAVIMSYEDIKNCFERSFNDVSFYSLYMDDDGETSGSATSQFVLSMKNA